MRKLILIVFALCSAALLAASAPMTRPASTMSVSAAVPATPAAPSTTTTAAPTTAVKPTATHKAKPAIKPSTISTPKHVKPKTPKSFDQALRSAIASVPGADSAHWVVRDMGSWGATDLSSGTVYIAPRTPRSRLLDVVRHEYVHVLQGRLYGSIGSARAALAPYGGIEINADCGARLMGASWTNYTSHCTATQTIAARKVLSGHRP